MYPCYGTLTSKVLSNSKFELYCEGNLHPSSVSQKLESKS